VVAKQSNIMKKFTLLFATLLAMSGTVFGQIIAKLVSETEIDTVMKGAYINYIRLNTSSAGNTAISYDYTLNGVYKSGVKAYDKNSKLIWNGFDFYQKPSTRFSLTTNGTYSLVNNFESGRTTNFFNDSTLYFNKELKLNGKLYTRAVNYTALMPVDDGIFYYEDGKALVKYDSEGKEEWRYLSPYPVRIANTKAPYTATIVDNSTKQKIIILNNKGQKIGDTGNTIPLNGQTLLGTNDAGFWYIPANPAIGIGFGKYDSTGKVTGGISPYASENKWWVQGKTLLSSYATMADNSLFMSLIGNDGIMFVKVEANGDMKRHSVSTQIKFPNDINPYYTYKVVEGKNKVIYAFPMKETSINDVNGKYMVGVVDFDNLSASWHKEIDGGVSVGFNENRITFEEGNTFFQVYTPDDNTSIKKCRVYNSDGTLKWESSFSMALTLSLNPPAMSLWRKEGNYLYINAIESNKTLIKVAYNDGKIVWKRPGVSVYNFQTDLKFDKDGNEYILNDFGANLYKISLLKADGNEKWAIPAVTDAVYGSNTSRYISYSLTDDGKVNVFLATLKGNAMKLMLRKYIPCNYNFSTAMGAVVASTQILAYQDPSTQYDGKELCSDNKIKLQAPKFEGAVYEWQRDGKIIPDLKDAVHDVNVGGVYKLTIKDTVCQYSGVSNEIKINIRNPPTAEIKAPKTTFCEGDKTTITATTNGVFFQWQKDGKDIPSATSGIYEVSQAGEYRVGVRDDKCPQVGLSNIIPITIKPLPEAKITTDIKTVIYEPFTVKMTANIGTGLSYQWLKDDVIIPNETSNVYEAKKSGKYNVSVTKDGCQKTSEALNISIQIALSAESEINEETVQIYPNPSRGEFKLILPKSMQNAEIQLFDLLGRERTLTYTSEQARAEALVQGTYFLRVTKGEKVVTNKIVIE
jgi:Secretion system C-terminal sorting domain